MRGAEDDMTCVLQSAAHAMLDPLAQSIGNADKIAADQGDDLIPRIKNYAPGPQVIVHPLLPAAEIGPVAG